MALLNRDTQMTHKITQKIVSYKVLAKDAAEPVKPVPEQPSLERMNEKDERPEL